MLTAPLRAAAPPDYFPLEKGNFWEYSAFVEYSFGDSSKGPLEVKKQHLFYKVQVIDHLNGEGCEAALLDGFPSDLESYDPAKLHRKCIIFRTGSNHYFQITENVEALWKRYQADQLEATSRGELNEDSLLIQAPLSVDARFGDLSETASGRYCWVVEDAYPVDARKIPGAPPGRGPAYTVAFRTSPDHVIIDFLPGVGILAYTYGHHGTIDNVSATLTRFGHETAASR